MFSGFGTQALTLLSYQMEEIECSRGQVIYREGDDVDQMVYLVKKGEFQCSKTISRKKDETGAHIEQVYGVDT